MEIKRLTKQLQHSMLAFLLAGVCPSGALAQNGHSHETNSQTQQLTQAQGALLKIVRDNTERFKDVAVAQAEGYSLLFGCVSGPDSGAMGMHFVNLNLVGAGVIDATRPQIVIYEPTPNGGPKLTGADYLVFADTWNAKHSSPPELMGQLFHLFDAPNRFGLPAFYTLHVWAWKDNPLGTFTNWNPNVSCDGFNGVSQ